jgi:hypothetical protein
MGEVRALREELRSQRTTQLDKYMSVAEVAEAVGKSVHTVRKWLKDGKPGHNGKIIKLYSEEPSPGFPLIPWSAVRAYNQGLPYDASQAGLPAPASKTLPREVLDSGAALRVAS